MAYDHLPARARWRQLNTDLNNLALVLTGHPRGPDRTDAVAIAARVVPYLDGLQAAVRSPPAMRHPAHVEDLAGLGLAVGPHVHNGVFYDRLDEVVTIVGQTLNAWSTSVGAAENARFLIELGQAYGRMAQGHETTRPKPLWKAGYFPAFAREF